MDMNMADFSRSFILAFKKASAVETKAVSVFVEEIQKRTGIVLPIVYEYPEQASAVIIIGSEETAGKAVSDITPLKKKINRLNAAGPEGYKAVVYKKPIPTAAVIGSDERGVLYGVGKLLRKMQWSHDSIGFPQDFAESSTPEFSLRGHQLGYRPKTNAYDAWTPEIYDQYIRDLALFGSNSIELTPPRTDDDPTSPLMKYDSLDMMGRLSEIIHSYGMDVWVWYPNMADEYVKPETIAFEMAEREDVFSRVPHIDHLFIPGGDPGELDPAALFAWTKTVDGILKKYHANAKTWLSPQTFTPSRGWTDAFYAELAKEPDWLYGVVFGPWEKDAAELLRKATPQRYPIRNYPDITHCFRCQFPVPKWDMPFALTLGRECINPRPKDEKLIHNTYKDFFIGSVSYSEGINDDVNKFIWCDQEWDSQIPVIDTLRDFGRFFIDYEMADDIAQGILALELNFRGPLGDNINVDTCLKQWKSMEKRVCGFAKENYRFEMGLLRAYYDAYQKQRYIYEKHLENEAMYVLSQCRELGPDESMDKAMEILKLARTKPVRADLRKRIDELADLLFAHIGAQLTVSRHSALHWGRGGFVECVDIPLNDYRYLSAEIKRIRSLKNPVEILASANPSAPGDMLGVIFSGDDEYKCKNIEDLINRTDPGPGGFYDNLGSWASWHRIKDNENYREDPGFLHSALSSFIMQPPHDYQDEFNLPLSWQWQACAMYTKPLVVTYDNLDPEAAYIIRISYAGYFGQHIKLVANENYMIHDYIITDRKFITMEFVLPKETYRNGCLTLSFTALDGERGANVGEIWIIKQPKKL